MPRNTRQLLKTISLAGAIQPTVTSFIRHSNVKTLKEPTNRILCLFILLNFISFALAADGTTIASSKAMDSNNLLRNREHVRSVTSQCKDCVNSRLMMSILDVIKRRELPVTSQTQKNKFFELTKTLRHSCKGLSYQRCRQLRQEIERNNFKKTQLSNELRHNDVTESQTYNDVRTIPTSPLSDVNNPTSRFLSREKRQLPTGDRRLVQMHCKTNYILEIKSDGKVVGSRTRNPNTVLEIRSVAKGGVVSFYSASTGYYLAMNSRGQLYGERVYSDEHCAFVERFHENFWSTYSSLSLPNTPRKRKRRSKRSADPAVWYVAIAKSGKPRKASKIRNPNHSSAQFLPRPLTL